MYRISQRPIVKTSTWKKKKCAMEKKINGDESERNSSWNNKQEVYLQWEVVHQA